MPTARDICREALTLSGIVGLGDSIGDDVMIFALNRFNDVLGMMSSERLLKYSYKIENGQIVNGTKELTIGPSGDIPAKRPYKIDSIKYLQGTTKIVIPQISPTEFVTNFETNNSTGLPSEYAYFPNEPNGVIRFRNPVGSAYDIEVAFLDYIESYGLNDEVIQPATYIPYFKYATAVEIARAQVLTSTLQTLEPKALEVKHNLMMQNANVPHATSDFDAEEGWYVFRSDQII